MKWWVIVLRTELFSERVANRCSTIVENITENVAKYVTFILFMVLIQLLLSFNVIHMGVTDVTSLRHHKGNNFFLPFENSKRYYNIITIRWYFINLTVSVEITTSEMLLKLLTTYFNLVWTRFNRTLWEVVNVWEHKHCQFLRWKLVLILHFVDFKHERCFQCHKVILL